MSVNNRPNLNPGKSGNLLAELGQRIKLIIRLMGDPRVNLLVKVLPILSLGYILFPDIPGPIDDALVVWLGTTLFVELCPREVVQEHLNALSGSARTAWSDQDRSPLDVEARDERLEKNG